MPGVIEKAVVNTSPIIVLARIGQIDLLQALYKQIIIPGGVADEIRAGPEDDPARLWLAADGRALVRSVGQVDPTIAAWDLGAGETEVLTLARRNPDFEAIVDDRAARNCAITLKIAVRGTLGIVLLAKNEGYLPAVKLAINQLVNAGLRLDPAIIDEALKTAGEAD